MTEEERMRGIQSQDDDVEVHLLRQWAAGEKPQAETERLLAELDGTVVEREPYLVHGEQHDGEHEHRVSCIVWAKDQVELNIFIEGKIFTHDSGEMDSEDAFFGYGDCMTATRFTGSEAITEEEADMLQRLGVAHYWNNPSFAVAHDSKISPYAKAGGHPAAEEVLPEWTDPSVDTWKVNEIQFPRLIAEAEAEGLFHVQAVHDLCIAMDLSADDVSEIIDRAQLEWDKIKARTPVGKPTEA